MFRTKGGVTRSPLAGVFKHLLRQKGDTGFSSATTAEEVAASWNGTGKVAIVTGASTGLGLEASRVLAAQGCEVVMGVRDIAKAQKNVDTIMAAHPTAKISIYPLDLMSLKSVKAFAQRFQDSGKPLHILMCNAGVMMTPFRLSEEGHESQFATNHLSHFYLVKLLLNDLISTAEASKANGRIVVLSSTAHMGSYPGGIRFDKLHDPKTYDKVAAYGQSKLCNVLFTRSLNEKLKDTNVTAACCHPGVIATELARDLPSAMHAVLGVFRPVMKSIPQGAATQVFLATAPTIEGGEYYTDCNVFPSSLHSHSRRLADTLWEVSEQLCKDT